MPTFTIENEVLTIQNGNPPALITVTAPPQLVVTQTPGVGPPGPSGVFVGPSPPSDTSLVWVDTS